MKLSDTCNWIDKFHKLYHTVKITGYDMIWIKEAFNIGSKTYKFLSMYIEELNDLCNKYEFPKGEWFVRTDKVSLKYGIYGIGPYNNLKNIIESIVTTTYNHICFDNDESTMTIYMLPWKKLSKGKKIRIFVNNSRITAISEQHLTKIVKIKK